MPLVNSGCRHIFKSFKLHPAWIRRGEAHGWRRQPEAGLQLRPVAGIASQPVKLQRQLPRPQIQAGPFAVRKPRLDPWSRVQTTRAGVPPPPAFTGAPAPDAPAIPPAQSDSPADGKAGFSRLLPKPFSRYFGSIMVNPFTWVKCRRLKVATAEPRMQCVSGQCPVFSLAAQLFSAKSLRIQAEGRVWLCSLRQVLPVARSSPVSARRAPTRRSLEAAFRRRLPARGRSLIFGPRVRAAGGARLRVRCGGRRRTD